MKFFTLLATCLIFLIGCEANEQNITAASSVEEEQIDMEEIELNKDTFKLELESINYNKEENSVSVNIETGLPDGTIVYLSQYMPSVDLKYHNLFRDVPVIDTEVLVEDNKISHVFTDEDFNSTSIVSAEYYYDVKIPTSSEINSFIFENYLDETEFEKAFPEFEESVVRDDEIGGYQIIEDSYKVTIDNAYSLEEIMSEYTERAIPYKELEKNPDSLIGNQVMYKGRIIEIQETDVDYEEKGYSKETVLRLNTSEDPREIIYVTYNSIFSTDFVRDDVITIYGDITGAVTYESVAGYQITIPSVDAKVLE